MLGMGNSRLPAISMNCIAIYVNSMELLVACMRFNIVCMHYGEQFASILPICGEFLGADILVVFIIFFNKSVEIGCFFIVYMFVHGFQVKNNFSSLSLF
jgi:hypothetical protein